MLEKAGDLRDKWANPKMGLQRFETLGGNFLFLWKWPA
jgi:hypothetical protein